MTPQQWRILREVSDRTGISVEQIRSGDRSQYVVSARHEVMKRLYDLGCYSLSQIGSVVGKDHSTVAHAVGRLQRKKPSRRGWHSPYIGHLHCLGCKFCKVEQEKPEPAPPRPTKRTWGRRSLNPAKRYLIPYAGADPHDYRPKERQS
jgi:hypothetical protein